MWFLKKKKTRKKNDRGIIVKKFHGRLIFKSWMLLHLCALLHKCSGSMLIIWFVDQTENICVHINTLHLIQSRSLFTLWSEKRVGNKVRRFISSCLHISRHNHSTLTTSTQCRWKVWKSGGALLTNIGRRRVSPLFLSKTRGTYPLDPGSAGSATLDLVVVSGGKNWKLKALFLDFIISVTIQIIQQFFSIWIILLVATSIK